MVPLLLVALVALGSSGCAQRAWNARMGDATGQRYELRNHPQSNAEELFVVLAFSGGGTRAAAFSYGVLQSLRDTSIHVRGAQRRLLDEVDVITAVSGGSYTAAYYGLFGERLFSDFRDQFLYRDWQSELTRLAVRPHSLAATLTTDYNRSDLVAAYLGRTLYDHATFAELSRGGLPYVIINASDLNNATTFSFIQQQFDFLCSDLLGYPVANAVMASSAVPGAFASMALRNYPDCRERHQPWVADALAHDDFLSRRRTVALALERYSHPERMPVLRLVDGGVTDNLGVRGSMMSPALHYGDVPGMAGAFTSEQLKRVRKVLVIIVNAQVYPETNWAVAGHEPGLIGMVRSSFDAALGILNSETVALAKREFLMWEAHANAVRGREAPPVKVYFSVLTFDRIADTSRRDRFNAMPTTFRLRVDQVDALAAEAGSLLQQSVEFRDFLRDLSADDHSTAARESAYRPTR